MPELSDDELFAEVSRARARGADVQSPLGELVERWKAPARYVIRKIQQSYRKGSPEDELEIFQDAVARLLDRGLDQFRGVSEHTPGTAASPRTFFLRIVKHLAIDRYRRSRELLSEGPREGEEEREESAHEAARAMEASRQSEQAREAQGEYWQAFRRLEREHPNEARAWDLYHHQDLEDHGEVAKALGITVVNSYKRVSRAQAYLKLYLLELSGDA